MRANIVKNEEETKVGKTKVGKTKYNFNVISTFLDGEQDIFDITLNSDNVKNEATFLSTLFQGEENLQSLVKYSICQKGVTESEALPYLVRSGGKYYFNEENIGLLHLRNLHLV